MLRDGPGHLERRFVVKDGAYLSARWPGDAHRFAAEIVAVVEAAPTPSNSSQGSPNAR